MKKKTIAGVIEELVDLTRKQYPTHKIDGHLELHFIIDGVYKSSFIVLPEVFLELCNKHGISIPEIGIGNGLDRDIQIVETKIKGEKNASKHSAKTKP